MTRSRSAPTLKVVKIAAILVCITLIVAILQLAKVVLIPIALAILVTFVLSPLVRRLDRLGLSRVLSVLIVVGAGGLLLTVLGWVVFSQLRSLANDLPNYRANIREKVATLTQGTRGGVLEKVQLTIQDAAREAEEVAEEAAEEEAEEAADEAAEEQAEEAAEEAAAEDAETVPGADAGSGADAGERSADQQAGGLLRDAQQNDSPRRDGQPGPGQRAEREKPMLVRIAPEDGAEKAFGAAVASLFALGPVFEILATGGLAMVLMIFMLISQEDLRNRLVSFTANGSLATTTKALDDAGQRISRYLIMQLIINGTFGLAVGLGLLLIGVPYAFLWGLCATVFRYIPYIGPWVAALLPLTVSLITSPGWIQLILVLGLFLTLELLSNNIMEPWLYGQGVGVSIVALLVSATFWTWTWGPLGLILATPLTVCLVVTGKYVPALSFLDRLLGDQPALPPFAAYLQRMLARDDQEAGRIVHQYCGQHPAETVYDEVLIPALAMARRDRSRGTMNADEETFLLKSTSTILSELVPSGKLAAPAAAAEHPPADASLAAVAGRHDDSPAGALGSQQEDPDDEPTPPLTKVLGCAAHQEAEELTLHMLDQLVSTTGLSVEVLSTRTLPSDVFRWVERERPAVVVIAALPPGGLIQASYLCKQLRKRFPELGIVVGCWGHRGDLDRVISKLRTAGAQYITTTLLGAREQVRALAQTPSDSVAAPPAKPQLVGGE